MADRNQHDISLADDTALPDGPSTLAQSGLSFSRRVKIGIVLLLMLCGYFLMDDRPHPGSISTDVPDTSTSGNSQMPDFIEDLNFVAAKASLGQTQLPVEPTAIRLPVAPAYNDTGDVKPAIPTGHQSHHLETRHSSSLSTEIVRGSVVRFTGHIEPLH